MMMTNVDKGKKLQIFENQLAFLEYYTITFQVFPIKLEERTTQIRGFVDLQSIVDFREVEDIVSHIEIHFYFDP